MANLQIKDLPVPLHEELRRRSQQRHVTMRDYVLDLIRHDLALPAAEEWLARVETLAPAPGVSAAEVLREERAGRGDDRGR